MLQRILVRLLFMGLLGLPALFPRAVGPPVAVDLAEIDAYVLEQMERSAIPGLAYAIIEDGAVVHLQAFGVAGPDGRLMTPQTPLFIGSVGKTFTALAALQLSNAGKLHLDEPVVHYLPWFTLADAQAARQITVRQLLNHTSGFSNLDGSDPALYRPDRSSEQLVRQLAPLSLNRPVGASYEYSNINYIILGQVLEVAADMPYEQYLQQYIFEPLEMEHSYTSEAAAQSAGLSEGYRYWFGLPVAVDLSEPPGAMAAGFQISTAEDMAHYLIAFSEHGRYEDLSVVNADGLPHPDDVVHHYTIDWIDRREADARGNTEVHSGGWLNYSSGIAFMPYAGIGVAVLANSYPAQWLDVKDAFAITYDVLRLYTGNPPEPLKPRLATLYLLWDLLLLGIGAFVVYRWQTVRGWRRRLAEGGHRLRRWLPVVSLDLLLPLFLLLAWPVVRLSTPGNIRYNPWWNWNRLAFSVPDITLVLLLAAASLLLVGLWKLLLALRQPAKAPVLIEQAGPLSPQR